MVEAGNSSILRPDSKGESSLTLGDVILKSKDYFPDPRFRPKNVRDERYYKHFGIDVHGYEVAPPNMDGTGTKPEMAERMYALTGDPRYFRTLAFDVGAMLDTDIGRWGHINLGLATVIDVNSVDKKVIPYLAEGLDDLGRLGRFPILNGENAGLGYRTSGYGDTRLNWNGSGLSIIVPDKEITGENLAPGQLVVGMRELGLRSNGFTDGRASAELIYILKNTPYKSKLEYAAQYLRDGGLNVDNLSEPENKDRVLIEYLSKLMNHDFLEQVLVPWHEKDPGLAEALLEPSKIYGPIIYDAQGGVDGKQLIDIVAAAHISGGGVPEKGMRMVAPRGLGLSMEQVFPEPAVISRLLEINEEIKGIVGEENAPVKNDREASEKWNRGYGFLAVVKDQSAADELIAVANSHNVEAAVAGMVIDKKEVQFKDQIWLSDVA